MRSALYQRLVEALDALEAPDGGNASWPFDENATERTSPGIEDVLAAIEEAAGKIERVARSCPPGENRWLLTDFWLDAFYLDARRWFSSPETLHQFRERFLEVRRRTIPPTFVVVAEPNFEPFRMTSTERDEQRPIASDTPILRLQGSRPDDLSEILAACQASRADVIVP